MRLRKRLVNARIEFGAKPSLSPVEFSDKVLTVIRQIEECDMDELM